MSSPSPFCGKADSFLENSVRSYNPISGNSSLVLFLLVYLPTPKCKSWAFGSSFNSLRIQAPASPAPPPETYLGSILPYDPDARIFSELSHESGSFDFILTLILFLFHWPHWHLMSLIHPNPSIAPSPNPHEKHSPLQCVSPGSNPFSSGVLEVRCSFFSPIITFCWSKARSSERISMRGFGNWTYVHIPNLDTC